MKTFIIKRNDFPFGRCFGRAYCMAEAKRCMRALGFTPSMYKIEEMTPETVAAAERTVFIQPDFVESRQIIFGRLYFREQQTPIL